MRSKQFWRRPIIEKTELLRRNIAGRKEISTQDASVVLRCAIRYRSGYRAPHRRSTSVEQPLVVEHAMDIVVLEVVLRARRVVVVGQAMTVEQLQVAADQGKMCPKDATMGR